MMFCARSSPVQQLIILISAFQTHLANCRTVFVISPLSGSSAPIFHPLQTLLSINGHFTTKTSKIGHFAVEFHKFHAYSYHKSSLSSKQTVDTYPLFGTKVLSLKIAS